MQTPEHVAAKSPKWMVTINGQTKIVPAPNALVAMHRGIEGDGPPDSEIRQLEVRRVR